MLPILWREGNGVGLKGLGAHRLEEVKEIRTYGIRKTSSMGEKVGMMPSVLGERAGGKRHGPVGLDRTGEPGLIN